MSLWQKAIKNSFDSLATKRVRYPKIADNNLYITTKDKKYLNFVSNDYLGLSENEEIKEALISGVTRYGVGSTGAATLSGFHQEEREFRIKLAKWLGFEKALTFTSGYQLNVGIYKQLIDMAKIQSNDLPIMVWLDRQCHASHIDGIMLAKAKFSTFDENSLDHVIAKIKNKPEYLHIILTEGIFSMDGSCNYLDKLILLKKENILGNVLLIVDDAHGIGALGENGRGFCSNCDMTQIDLLIGTLGKTFATHGGFICGNELLIDYLEQTVRSHLFTTCLPPAIYRASSKSLDIIKSQVGGSLRETLAKIIMDFKAIAKNYQLPVDQQEYNFSPIQLLVFESSDMVDKIYNDLLGNNIMVGRILYPTVSIDTPRIRISITAQHKHEHLQLLCERISDVLGVA